MRDISLSSGARRLVTLCAVGAVALAGGCQNAQEGAVSGGAIGALSGLAIGSLAGGAGEGAAIGAVVGVVGGAIIGDQNRRNKELAEEEARGSASPAPAPRVEYKAAPMLDRLIGRWSINGWLVDVNGNRINVSGTADARADKSYFLQIDVHVSDPRSGETIDGTSIISQEGGNRLTMSNSFSSAPGMKVYTGEADTSGQIMTFRLSNDGGSMDRRVTIRLMGSDRWTAEGWERRDGEDTKIESLTFTRAG